MVLKNAFKIFCVLSLVYACGQDKKEKEDEKTTSQEKKTSEVVKSKKKKPVVPKENQIAKTNTKDEIQDVETDSDGLEIANADTEDEGQDLDVDEIFEEMAPVLSFLDYCNQPQMDRTVAVDRIISALESVMGAKDCDELKTALSTTEALFLEGKGLSDLRPISN